MSLQKVFSLFAILVMLSSMLTVWPEERQRHPEMMQEHSDRMSEEQEMLSEREQERIYGWQIMTPEERLEHRNKMRSSGPEKSGKPTGANTMKRCKHGQGIRV